MISLKQCMDRSSFWGDALSRVYRYVQEIWATPWCVITLGVVSLAPWGVSAQRNQSPSGETQRDPALRMGTLSNGLRYYVRANPTPDNRAEFWLAVNAGSLQEDEDQLGYAHFLEHMAFNGTRNFPKQALVDFVESAGMQFGGDLNAYTIFDETVYTLTLPTDDRKFMQNGLQILHDWAGGGILIDSNEVLAERGVVLGEWRSRMGDSIATDNMQHQWNVVFGKDSRYRHRFPIGKASLLKNAQPAPLKRFYRDWYRPDLMAVIVVGDIDPTDIEQEIRKRFGSIPVVKNPRPQPSPNLRVHTGSVVDVYRGIVPLSATVLWPAPAFPKTTDAMIRQQLLENIFFQYLQDRFVKLQTQERRPFGIATVGRSSLVRLMDDMYSIGVGAPADSLESGLAAVLTEIERVAQHGIPAAQLERRKAALLRQLESFADAERAVPSKAFAKSYVEHYLSGKGALVSASQELTIARQVLPAITSQALASAARIWRDEHRRIVMYNIHALVTAAPPTEAKLLALIDSVAGVTLPALPDSNTQSSSGLSVSTNPGRIVAERQHTIAGITEWTLSNGARVFFKPTNSNPDELLMYAHSWGGTSLLPDSLALSPARLVGMMMTAAGGVGDATREQLQQRLNTTLLTTFHVSLNYLDESILMGGSPKELETLFNLLYLQFTAPKLDTAAVSAWKRYGDTRLEMSINDQIASTLGRGNPRLASPSPAMVPFVNVEQALSVYRDRFGDASDFTFTIIGAARPERVKPLVERYIASLPSTHRRERERPKDPNIRPLVEIERRTERYFTVPKVSTMLAFDAQLSSEPDAYLSAQQEIHALTYVLRRRLREELREKLGGTYGAGVSPSFYANPKEHSQMIVSFDAAPNRADTLIGVLFQQLDSVRKYGASPKELQVVETIQRRTRELQLQSNQYWISTIQQYDRLGIPLDRIPEHRSVALTPELLRNAAQKYIPSSAYLQFTYIPVDSTVTDSAAIARQERDAPSGNGGATL